VHEHAAPIPFTADDFAARRARAAEVGREAGLAGLLMTPDLCGELLDRVAVAIGAAHRDAGAAGGRKP